MTDDTKPLSGRMRESAKQWGAKPYGGAYADGVLVAITTYVDGVEALESQLAARDATIERLKAALHPGPSPNDVWRVDAAMPTPSGHWRGDGDSASSSHDWCDRANRYEQLTGEKV